MSRSTFSKHENRYPAGYSKRIVQGRGSRITDSDGREYVDWVQGLGGAGIFGHDFLSSIKSIGTAFHLPHPVEDEVAELLRGMLPWAEETRFALDGTDVTAGAVRLARAVTRRESVIVFEDSYHGESTGDWSISAKPGVRGLTNLVRPPVVLPWNEPKELYTVLRNLNVAAVIFEVANTDPTPEFVAMLNSAAQFGTLLIADEVVTGFRLGEQGACGRYGIKPDLACYGKALGSGIPIAALCGKRVFMREFDLAYTNYPVFMSFTHAGNVLCLSGAKATLEEIQKRSQEIYFQLWTTGKKLMTMFQFIADSFNLHNCKAVGQPERSHFKFDATGSLTSEALRAVFIQSMQRGGVLMGVPNFPTLAHSIEDLEYTGIAMESALANVRAALVADSVEGILQGPVPISLYSVRKEQSSEDRERAGYHNVLGRF